MADRTTRVADRLAWLIGWMGTRPVITGSAGAAGNAGRSQLQVTPASYHGRTPFNSWLLVAALRSAGPSGAAHRRRRLGRYGMLPSPTLGCSPARTRRYGTGSRAFSRSSSACSRVR